MSYDENFMPSLEASANEATAERQMQLDIVDRLCKQYAISMQDVALICQLAGIPLDELMNYSGVTA